MKRSVQAERQDAMAAEHGVNLPNAVRLFKQGDFAEAKTEFEKILARSPQDVKALIYTGYIALLENRLKDAEKHLRASLDRMPRPETIKSLLFDVYCRQDDYANALSVLDENRKKALAPKLEHFQNNKAYEVLSMPAKAELEFAVKNPLPLVPVSINGAPPANFLIDTSGGELIIDADYAKRLGLKALGSEIGFFAADRKNVMIHSYADMAQLGGLRIKNLPVSVLDTKRFSSGLYGNQYQIDGILGTSVFHHFLTTLDFANERIIFEPLGGTERLLKDESYAHIPFWMASDHYMFARGSANQIKNLLFFIDTGLAGNAFTCPKSTLKKCKFRLNRKKTAFGLGGGGKVKLVPFEIESLSLGGVCANNLHGVYGPFPPSLEKSFGFTVDGLISHEFFLKRSVTFYFTNMLLHVK